MPVASAGATVAVSVSSWPAFLPPVTASVVVVGVAAGTVTSTTCTRETGSAFWCWNTSSCPSAAPVPLCTGMVTPSSPSVENEPGDVVVEPERRVVRVHRERLGRVQDAGVGRRVVGRGVHGDRRGGPDGDAGPVEPDRGDEDVAVEHAGVDAPGEPVDELDVEVLARVVVERRGDGDVGVVVVLLDHRLQVVGAVTVDVDVDDGDDVAAERGPLPVGRDADAEQARGRVATGCGDRRCRGGPADVPDVTGGGGRRRRDEPRDVLELGARGAEDQRRGQRVPATGRHTATARSRGPPSPRRRRRRRPGRP